MLLQIFGYGQNLILLFVKIKIRLYIRPDPLPLLK